MDRRTALKSVAAGCLAPFGLPLLSSCGGACLTVELNQLGKCCSSLFTALEIPECWIWVYPKQSLVVTGYKDQDSRPLKVLVDGIEMQRVRVVDMSMPQWPNLVGVRE